MASPNHIDISGCGQNSTNQDKVMEEPIENCPAPLPQQQTDIVFGEVVVVEEQDTFGK